MVITGVTAVRHAFVVAVLRTFQAHSFSGAVETAADFDFTYQTVVIKSWIARVLFALFSAVFGAKSTDSRSAVSTGADFL